MRSISVENFWPCAPNVLRNTPVFSSSTRCRSLPRWLMLAVSSSALAVKPRATSALTPSSARSTSPAFCFSTVVTPVATVESARSASAVPRLIAPVTSPEDGADLARRLVGAGAQRFRGRAGELAERALDLARVLLQRRGDAGGDRGERAFGILRAGADRLGGRGGEIAERMLRVLRAGTDRLGRGGEQVVERLLDALRAVLIASATETASAFSAVWTSVASCCSAPLTAVEAVISVRSTSADILLAGCRSASDEAVVHHALDSAASCAQRVADTSVDAVVSHVRPRRLPAQHAAASERRQRRSASAAPGLSALAPVTARQAVRASLASAERCRSRRSTSRAVEVTLDVDLGVFLSDAAADRGRHAASACARPRRRPA